MSLVTVKLYGRYYNVDHAKGEHRKHSLERAVALKRLGKPFSGPAEAKKAMPKEKVEKAEPKKVESEVKVEKKAKPIKKIKAKKKVK